MCAVVLVPWCTRKAFYKGKGCWIVFGGSFSHYCTAGHFVNGSLMIETTCARPRITFPFGSWSEGFSFTGGQEKNKVVYKTKDMQQDISGLLRYFEMMPAKKSKIQCSYFSSLTIFSAAMKSVPKNVPKICGIGQTCCGGVQKPEWDSVRQLWRNLFFFKYFFLRMTVVGKAGQANKSRKEW